MSNLLRTGFALLVIIGILLSSCSPLAQPGRTIAIAQDGVLGLLDSKTGKLTLLDQTGGGASISPDYKKMIFADWNNESENFHTLYIMDINGKNRKPLLSQDDIAKIGGEPWPSYYWLDNKTILMTIRGGCGFSNPCYIYMMNVETGEYTRIFSHLFEEFFVSPDGKTLIIQGVFSFAEGFKDIIINIDGSGERDFGQFQDEHDYPDEVIWLAEPNKVVVIVANTQTLESYIATVDLETNEMITLVPAKEVDMISMVLSPDGNYLAFASANRGKAGDSHAEYHDIYVLNLIDGSISNLTNSPDVDDLYPSWVMENKVFYFSGEYRAEGTDTCTYHVIGLNGETPEAIYSYSCES